MDFITSLLGIPLGWIMYFFYHLTNHYVLSLLFFTIITRLIMIPFTLKQQKSTVKMTMIKPEIDELQKRYAKDRVKLNEELMKLYSRVGYSPTAGCLPLLIQFPILFGLIDVIYKPLTHVLRLPAEAIEAGMQVIGADTAGRIQQLSIISGVKEAPERFAAMGPEALAAIESLNLNFWGMDLSQTPTTGMFLEVFSNFNPLIFIPIFAGVTSLLMSMVTMRTSSAAMDGAAGSTMKSMMFTMPILSVVIVFSVPSGVGIYWSFSNLIAIAQSLIMNKVYNPKEAAEKAKAEMAERKEKERLERLEARKNDPNKGLSQKEINRRKLAEARKRDAEKYGETYIEVTDDDLK